MKISFHPKAKEEIHEGRSSIKTKFFKKNPPKCMQHDFLDFINSMRKRRKLLQGAKYHVMARANRREMILEAREMKEMFLDVVKRARKKYKFNIHTFCILGNHFHMILKPGEKENLSGIMQWILSVFAMKYNRTFDLIGHVFYDRFKSVIINDFRQYIATFIYIMENPVKAKIVERCSTQLNSNNRLNKVTGRF